MTPAEAKAHLNRLAVWRPPSGRPWPGCRILSVIEDSRTVVSGPRVWVRLGGFMSERDVAPDELSLT